MSFDYIVVGGGSAGCVVACRLSGRPENRVLLLEAGPRDLSPTHYIPAGALAMEGKLWNFATSPIHRATVRPCPGWPARSSAVGAP